MKTARFVGVIFVFLSFFSVSQTLVKDLKKKNYGVYAGEIPAYLFMQDTVTVPVAATSIEVSITDRAVEITIGRMNKKGSYHILFKGKNYYVIDAFFEGDILTERLILNEKSGTLIREGSYPQPNATLRKVKKKR